MLIKEPGSFGEPDNDPKGQPAQDSGESASMIKMDFKPLSVMSPSASTRGFDYTIKRKKPVFVKTGER